MSPVLSRRDSVDDGWWWYSDTAVAVKWAILSAIFLLFLAWFVGGYYHAKRRMRRGLPPLAYHRWLVPRAQRARFQNHFAQPQNDFSFYHVQNGNGNGEGYGMQAFPPPAYNLNHEAPPTYQPPMGGSKVNPSQDYAVPPPGPPPNGESSSSGQQDGPIFRPAESNGMNRLNPFR
ncbi:MAG: hypothetical protein FRX48_00365 [Lasallia pustulata]|uniref:Uncharacterized protein n=1 Tax=Lasallia pustulata TaxID=136370 RepID=A0A5M8Q3J9_9LECA|nr:MAG: hypothetical protein FRX48_00365 [Lasallia pustulata]